MGRYVGIDLGTTNTVVAAMRGGRPQVVPLGAANLLPSAVYFQAGATPVVGKAALGKLIRNPGRVIISAKRTVGSLKSIIDVDGSSYDATEVSRLILAEAKRLAEVSLGEAIDAAVITVPAYFTPRQYEETKRAAELAGLVVLELVAEPTAAAIAYGFQGKRAQRLAVLDLGGGTFDVCVLDVDDRDFRVLTVDGDRELGGDDFDGVLLDWLLEGARTSLGYDPAAGLEEERLRCRALLAAAAQETKVDLSDAGEADVDIPNLIDGRHLSLRCTRLEFEQRCAGLLARIDATIRRCLDAKDVAPSSIDRVILAGGATRMPMIRALTRGFFGREPYGDINPDECVALGAAVIAASTALPGVDGAAAPSGADTLPSLERVTFNRTLGSALGLLVQGQRVRHLLEKNTTIPARKTELFTTMEDNQEAVRIVVFYGDDPDPRSKHITLLGEFNLTGLRQETAGVPEIDITFALDRFNVLTVSAVDRKSGSSAVGVFTALEKGENPFVLGSDPAVIVFAIDTTGSMDSYIEGVLESCRRFVDRLEERDVAVELALIGFGDLTYGETMSVHRPTDDIEAFREAVRTLPRTGGGDLPESSLDALGAAMELVDASGKRGVIILVTDAPPHDPGVDGRTGRQLGELLAAKRISTHVIGPGRAVYKEIAQRTGGHHYTIRKQEKFLEIIDDLGGTIADALASR